MFIFFYLELSIEKYWKASKTKSITERFIGKKTSRLQGNLKTKR